MRTKVSVALAAAGLLTIGALAQSLAPPAISPRGVLNAASRMPPALSAGGIARGAIFQIAGPRLGPANPEQAEQGTPIPSLGGVSVEIEHVPVPLFYADQTRVIAWMPENVPLGIGKLTVSFRGQTSQEFSVGVVASAFGIFSTLREAELPSATRERILRGEPTPATSPRSSAPAIASTSTAQV